ncbi:MAG: zinc-ribbon domain-containing protein [Roseovarius sp.]|nr:zinc-ribbon domain-containing protein [Roseovarius sp.]
MRLVCPNCGAQYEVPDEVIPTGGRDVQCSNCGDTWFQHHPSSGVASGEDDMDAPPAWDKSPPAPAPPARHDDGDEKGDDKGDDTRGDVEPEAATAPAPTPELAPTATRRTVDPDVADILRQEADHERSVRASESAGGLETQPDLGLSDPSPAPDERSQQARIRMERLRGGTPPPDGTTPSAQDEHADIDPSSRRNLLPDIEEINSSLTSVNDRDEPSTAAIPEDMALPPRRSGFGTGFRLALVVFVLGTLAYVFAPQIAQMLPAAQAPLDSFVAAVNGLRLGLNDLIGSATGWLSDMGAPASGG